MFGHLGGVVGAQQGSAACVSADIPGDGTAAENEVFLLFDTTWWPSGPRTSASIEARGGDDHDDDA